MLPQPPCGSAGLTHRLQHPGVALNFVTLALAPARSVHEHDAAGRQNRSIGEGVARADQTSSMYTFDPHRVRGLRISQLPGIGPNVFLLGAISLLTDISSEMVVSILPMYLMYAVGLTPQQFGLVDGLSHGLASIGRLTSGLVADRWRRLREVAATGYAMSAVSRLVLLYSGGAWNLVSSAVVLDRLGKGIRTAPRDALISASSSLPRRGTAFGIHRAMDTTGAMLGPLLAFAILAWMPQAYDVVFVVSFFVGVIGVAIMLCFVRNVATSEAEGSESPRWRDLRRMMGNRRLGSVVLVGTGFGLLTVSDAFLLLYMQAKLSMSAAAFPLLYLAVAFSYLVLAIPAGWLADRFGRGPLFLCGHALLVTAIVSLLLGGSGLVSAAIPLFLLGAYYACTDGVLMAITSTLLPSSMRTTGLSIVATAHGLARLVSSLLLGAAWGQWGPIPTLSAFAVGLCLMLVMVLRTVLGWERNREQAVA